ncbi:MAG: hypothetical protein HMLKMBBP_01688 [Planctomycetes bacterium]|nr:hypothetical protein [Planctomycetota bacterium]
MDEQARETIARHAREVAALPNEAAKRVRFKELVGQLFPRSHATRVFAAGIEERIRLRTAEGKKNRCIDYRAAALNTGVVNATIKPFQSMGLLGQRDVHKKPLDLPIQIFDQSLPLHRRLARLGKDAHVAVQREVKSRGSGMRLSARRQLAREAASTSMIRIDRLVIQMLELK